MDETEAPTLTNIIEEILNDIKKRVEVKQKDFRAVLAADTSSDSSEDSDSTITSSNDSHTETEDNLVTSIRQKMKKLHKKSSKGEAKRPVVGKKLDLDEDILSNEDSDGEGRDKVALNQKYLKTKG
jgi:hypothetical protein